MRLVELATVSNVECLETLCVGVTVDSVQWNYLFLPFLIFSNWRVDDPDLDLECTKLN